MDVHIYYNAQDSDNLGLIVIDGSCTAEKSLKLVVEKLCLFGVSLEDDIVAVVSDSAAVMQKFGKLSPAQQQLCYNHGLHLAVLKVLYNKRNENDVEVDNISNESDYTNDDEENNEGSCSELESDVELIENTHLRLKPTIGVAI